MANVDRNIILGVDISNSIDNTEFSQMMTGYAIAFTQSTVISHIISGSAAAVAVMAYGWAENQKVLVDWHLINNSSAASVFATALNTATRPPIPIGTGEGVGTLTALANGIDFGLIAFDTAPHTVTAAGFNALNISGDGKNNNFSDLPRDLADAATSAGVTPVTAFLKDSAHSRQIAINAITILDDFSDLKEYFETNFLTTATGTVPAGFAITADDFSAYATAAEAKVFQELQVTTSTGAPIVNTNDTWKFLSGQIFETVALTSGSGAAMTTWTCLPQTTEVCP